MVYNYIVKNHYLRRLVVVKRIGVMTSGGDCPGLNSAIRAVVNQQLITLIMKLWL